MISIDGFDTLPEPEKFAFAYDHGTHLIRRLEGYAVTIDLYYAEGFFIEIWNSTVQPYAQYIRCLKKHRSLDPYLDQIDVRSALGRRNLLYED